MKRAIKRAIDVAVSGSSLVLLTPLLGLIALAIRLTLGSPVLFRQVRPGRHGRPFTLLKFRTMGPEPPDDASLGYGSDRLAADLARTPRVGRFLRRMSLDELPQLWNVLVGDMSLVGPRPLLAEYLPHYSASEARRHDVRPGLTGWAQVRGRRDLPMRERFALDVWYVDHWSLGLDLRILLRTVRVVLQGRESVEPPGDDPFLTMVEAAVKAEQAATPPGPVRAAGRPAEAAR